MPATFDDFGLRFMYPDNWVVADQDEPSGCDGVTIETPGGGFISIEAADPDLSEDEIFAQVRETLLEEYEQVEFDELEEELGDDTRHRIIEMQFYYLDLLITSRALLVETDSRRMLVQLQAEDRDFE
ncbi:MAG: hypothetical protein AAF989_15995, partial [Planctomycetota bacterium]